MWRVSFLPRPPPRLIVVCMWKHFFYIPFSAGEVYDAWPTEGGHSEMAPRNDLEYDLIKVSVSVRGDIR